MGNEPKDIDLLIDGDIEDGMAFAEWFCKKIGTYETSIVAPEWMDIHTKNKELFNNIREQNAFKSYQWKNTCKDNTKVTMLIDRDQKHALPLYLRDSYERYNTEI